jgi:hypothetical protein
VSWWASCFHEDAYSVHCNSGILQTVSARCFASKDTPKRFAMVEAIVILHDNMKPNVSGAVSVILEKNGWQLLPHLPYSPDMSPPDFNLFSKLKKPQHGKHFRRIEEVSNEVTRVIRRINNKRILMGIQDLPKCWTIVIKHNGYYTECL